MDTLQVLSTARVEDNEVVKAVDMNYGFTATVENMSRYLKMTADAENDFVAGGRVTGSGSDLTFVIEPLIGYHHKSDTMFLSGAEINGGCNASQAGRVDIVQVKGVYKDFEEQQRAFNDIEVNDQALLRYMTVNTKTMFAVEAVVKQGADGSSEAPEADDGYVKIAEIEVPAGATKITGANIKNITADIPGGENTGWTSGKCSVYNIGFLSQLKSLVRVAHNADGSHKDNSILSYMVKKSSDTDGINGANIPVGAGFIVGGTAVNAGDALHTALQAVAGCADGKAPEYHAAADGTYGLGSASAYGHVKVEPGNGLLIENGAVSFSSSPVFDRLEAQSLSLDTPLSIAGGGTGRKSFDAGALFCEAGSLKSGVIKVGHGGTGAGTAEVARNNLGVPPKSHAAADGTYGLGSASAYGHVKVVPGNGLLIENGAVSVNASSNANAGALVIRDAAGNAKIASPKDPADIADYRSLQKMISMFKTVTVDLATTNSVDHYGTKMVDGINTTVDTYVLEKYGNNKGIYKVESGTWTKVSDHPMWNCLVSVKKGTENGGKTFCYDGSSYVECELFPLGGLLGGTGNAAVVGDAFKSCGGGRVPVYFAGGIPVACSAALITSINGVSTSAGGSITGVPLAVLTAAPTNPKAGQMWLV